MPRGGWRTVVTVGLAILLAASAAGLIYWRANQAQVEYDHNANQYADTYRDTARVHAQSRCARVAAPERSNCADNEYHAARERERQERDLQAQLVTSAWTRAMGEAALIGMFVGIIGVGLIYTTLRETRKANSIARESMEGQLRPWVTFTTSATGRMVVVDECLELVTNVDFENIGQSPAIDLTYMGTMIFGDEVDPQFRTLIESFRAGSHDWADKNLFPGKKWPRTVCAAHTGDRNRAAKVTFVVIARYLTPFSPTYRFTARAFEAHTKRTVAGGVVEEGFWELPLDIEAGRHRGVYLVEKQHFSGYAT